MFYFLINTNVHSWTQHSIPICQNYALRTPYISQNHYLPLYISVYSIHFYFLIFRNVSNFVCLAVSYVLGYILYAWSHSLLNSYLYIFLICGLVVRFSLLIEVFFLIFLAWHYHISFYPELLRFSPASELLWFSHF